MAWRLKAHCVRISKPVFPNSWCLPHRPVDDLPLGSTGKVDRPPSPRWKFPRASRLRMSSAGQQHGGGDCQRLAAASFRAMCAWMRIFFDAGGNSLLIVRLYDALRPTFGPALTIADLFQYPTIASLQRTSASATNRRRHYPQWLPKMSLSSQRSPAPGRA